MSQIGTHGLLIVGRDAWFTRKVLGHANVVVDKLEAYPRKLVQ